MSRDMLDKWAVAHDERQTISYFWEWLLEGSADSRVGDIHLERTLDEYHGIDRAQLDRERRDLLSVNFGLDQQEECGKK